MPESNIPTNNSLPEFAGELDIHRQTEFDFDSDSVQRAVACILAESGFCRGSISIAVVSDAVIHELNAQYLQHDYATDVLSFLLHSDTASGWLEGEVIVSSDTAQSRAPEYGWSAQAELLLYIIHGTLHLVGMEDQTSEQRAAMQAVETRYLRQFGIVRPDPGSSQEDAT